MIKHMVQHGENAAIVIDEPIMELLDFNINTPLEVCVEGKSIIISPIADEKRDEKLSNSLEKINQKHGNTLAKLAQ